jgi:hypothetical protein
MEGALTNTLKYIETSKLFFSLLVKACKLKSFWGMKEILDHNIDGGWMELGDLKTILNDECIPLLQLIYSGKVILDPPLLPLSLIYVIKKKQTKAAIVILEILDERQIISVNLYSKAFLLAIWMGNLDVVKVLIKKEHLLSSKWKIIFKHCIKKLILKFWTIF